MSELTGDLPAAVELARSSLEKYGASVQSVEESSDHVELRNILGYYLMLSGNLDEAAAVLQEVFVRYPAQPLTNLRMAQVENRRGNNEAARRYLDVSMAAWSGASDRYDLVQEARELAATL
ncbi:MAG: hypothetical protein AAFN78_01965, partial [Pseudomonadota bacterium]